MNMESIGMESKIKRNKMIFGYARKYLMVKEF